MRYGKAILLALMALTTSAWGETVSSDRAASVASGWMRRGGGMGRGIRSAKFRGVRKWQHRLGGSFYAARFDKGTVFTSDDTDSEPIVAFTSSTNELTESSPLYDILCRDACFRARVRELRRKKGIAAPQRTSAKWRSLGSVPTGAPSGIGIDSEEEPEDDSLKIRVPPLLKTQWSQTTVSGAPYYNYMVWKEIRGVDPDESLVEGGKYPCGCTATALAQVIRYFEYPRSGDISQAGASAKPGHFVTVDGQTQGPFDLYRGTDGTGTGYDFDAMPGSPITVRPEERDAVAGLTYDCAVALESSFSPEQTSAYAKDTAKVLHSDLNYWNAFVYMDQSVIQKGEGTDAGLHSPELRAKVIYTNLDAGKPVLLGIYGYPKVNGITQIDQPVSGHAVVADGYGFTRARKTAYVHINLGWGGTDDAWYNLPEIDTTTVGAVGSDSNGFDFKFIGEALFNVEPKKVHYVGDEEPGEFKYPQLVTGHCVDDEGEDLGHVDIRLVGEDGKEWATATTGTNGVFAVYVNNFAEFEVQASSSDGRLGSTDRMRAGKILGNEYVVTTPSSVGNIWIADDIVVTAPRVRIGDQNYFHLDQALAAATTNDVLEILRPVKLRKSMTLDFNLTLTTTNANPYASQITRESGATLTVVGGTVTFSNVVFQTEGSAPVRVRGEGVARVTGTTVFDDVTSFVPGIDIETADQLVICGEILNGITVQTQQAGTPEAPVCRYTCDDAVVSRSAGRILCPTNDVLLGFADTASKTVVWSDQVPVDPVIAAASLDYTDEADLSHYRTVNQLMDAFSARPGSATITLLKNCWVTNSLDLVECEDVRLLSTNGAPVTLTYRDPETLIVVDLNSHLTLSNVVVTGAKRYGAFLVNECGQLTLDAGAKITGCTSTEEKGWYAGAISVWNGWVEMYPGSAIANCRSANYGGAIMLFGEDYFDDPISSDTEVWSWYWMLDLWGGTISGCTADVWGGGVYVGPGSYVEIGGNVSVINNTAGIKSFDSNVFLIDDTATFAVMSEVTSLPRSIGVSYNEADSDDWGNHISNKFVTVGEELAQFPAVVAKSAPAFVCDSPDEGYVQVGARGPNGEELVWEVFETTCDPSNAIARVIRPGGAVTNYYAEASDAFASVRADGTVVELLKDGGSYRLNIRIEHDVVFRAAKEAEGICTLKRTSDCLFEVAEGGSLVMSNVVVTTRQDAHASLLRVNGGSLTLGDGAVISDLYGDDIVAAGVEVWNGGTFTMESGSLIASCKNIYTEPAYDGGVYQSQGGGLCIENGTAYLRGGEIRGCYAALGGAVYLGASAKAYVSGDFTVRQADEDDGNDLYLVWDVETIATDGFDRICLDGKFTGHVDVTMDDISFEHPTVFGQVDADYRAGVPAAQLAAGAANFRNTLTLANGCVVTNATLALLVWEDAIQTDEVTGERYYLDAAGNRYGQIPADEPPPPPPPPPEYTVTTNTALPIAFSEISRVSETEWKLVVTDLVGHAEYALSFTPDLLTAFTTGSWFRAASSGVWTTNVVFQEAKPAYFWRAHGRTTYVTNYLDNVNK